MAAAAKRVAASTEADKEHITHLLVTNAGLEGVAAMEVQEVTGAKLIVPCPFGVSGYVGVGGLPAGGEEKLQDLRCIHDALKYHANFTLQVKMYVFMYACVYSSLNLCMYVCMHVFMYVRVCVCACACAYVCIIERGDTSPSPKSTDWCLCVGGVC